MRIILVILGFLFILFIFPRCSEEATNLVPTNKQIVESKPKPIKIMEPKTDDNTIVPADEPDPTIVTPQNVRGFNISDDDIVFGNVNSPVIVVEYFSPTCPSCAYYKQKVFPEIKKKYIDTNKIAYVIREFIARKQDLDAAILARCAGDKEGFLKFVTVIIGQQESWAHTSKYREILTNIGKLGGISEESYANCLNNDKILDTLISNSKFISKSPKFIGTPAFFINGIQFSKPFSFDILSGEIDDVLTKSLAND